jgi:uncharacterized protein YigE (DUF2233 family)
MLAGACIVAIISLQSRLVVAAEVTTVGTGSQVVELCKIDLSKDTVRTFWRDTDGTYFGSIAKVASRLHQRGERLVCASNAGIFGKDLRPLGLYAENGQILRRINTRKDGYGNFYLQPNGVFWLTQDGAAIASTDEVQSHWEQIAPQIKFATQSGPILLQANQINPLFTPGSNNRVIRNAICVKSTSKIVLAKSRFPINFYEFSVALRDGVGCHDGLFLDGSISELYPFEGRLIGTEFGPMIGVVVPITIP